ncbi:MAG: ATP-binding protein [Gemmatimonadales bacterium]
MDHLKLLARLRHQEDSLVERKPEGVKAGEIRATACAFANSVETEGTAVLFLGVSNDGAMLGVTNADSLQKTIRRQLSSECYPPIAYQAYVLEEAGKAIVAIVIPASATRPHFSGSAFVRTGSQSVSASPEQYERLIASRNTVAGALGRAIGETWTVVAIGKRLGDTKPIQQASHRESLACRIVDVNAHFVRLHDPSSGTNLTEVLVRAELSFDEKRHRRMLIVRGS